MLDIEQQFHLYRYYHCYQLHHHNPSRHPDSARRLKRNSKMFIWLITAEKKWTLPEELFPKLFKSKVSKLLEIFSISNCSPNRIWASIDPSTAIDTTSRLRKVIFAEKSSSWGISNLSAKLRRSISWKEFQI